MQGHNFYFPLLKIDAILKECMRNISLVILKGMVEVYLGRLKSIGKISEKADFGKQKKILNLFKDSNDWH